MLDRGGLSVLQWHERFHAGVYPGLSQADCDGRRTRRSQSVDHEICTHLADVSFSPIQTTNPEARASGVPSQQWLPIPANSYFHFQSIVQSSLRIICIKRRIHDFVSVIFQKEWFGVSHSCVGSAVTGIASRCGQQETGGAMTPDPRKTSSLERNPEVGHRPRAGGQGRGRWRGQFRCRSKRAGHC